MSDYAINFGVVQEAQLLLQQNATVYLYSFDYVSSQASWYPYFKGWLNIAHCYAFKDCHNLMLMLSCSTCLRTAISICVNCKSN